MLFGNLKCCLHGHGVSRVSTRVCPLEIVGDNTMDDEVSKATEILFFGIVENRARSNSSWQEFLDLGSLH